MPKTGPIIRCLVCRRSAADVKVLRFSMSRAATLAGGRKTSRGCGAIDLCAICWDNARLATGTKRRR